MGIPNLLNHADRAYLTIRDRILLGHYPAAHLIVARDAAAEFGGSQETISRVLVTLSAEGYLDAGARARGCVRRWSPSHLIRASSMRTQILSFAAMECSSRRKPLAIARLRAIVDVLTTHTSHLSDIDAVSDCLSLFETELCNGVGLDGLAQALRNAFPPILIRTCALVVNQLSLRRRLNAFLAVVDAIDRGTLNENGARYAFEPDAIDARMREKIAKSQSGVQPSEIDVEKLFSNRETTYDRWAAEVHIHRREATR